MKKTYSLLMHKVLICNMVIFTYLSTPGNTIKTKLIYKLNMERTSTDGAILECKKNGGYLAPMNSPFTPHLISVMADLYRQKKLEAHYKLTVGIRWSPEGNNWTWIYDGSVVPEETVNYWQLPKTPSQYFCTCLWLGANKTWTVGPFSCGPEHRAICRYNKGACSYTKCPGNALLPLDPIKGLTQNSICTAETCEDTCSGYVSTNMSCVGYSYNTLSSECVLQLSSIWPIWTSSNLQVDPNWEATIVNCLEIIYVAQLKPLNEYLVYPLEDTKLCKTPPVIPGPREVSMTVTETVSITGDGSLEFIDTGDPAATSPALTSDWITTVTPRVSESNTETPSVSESNTETLRVSESNTETLRVSESNTEETPKVSESNTETKSLSESDTETPRVSKANTETPRVSESNTETPRVSEPNIETPRVSESDTETPRVSESNTEKMIPHQAAYTSRIVSETPLVYTTITGITEGVVGKTTTEPIVHPNTSYQSVTTPNIISEKSSETPTILTVSSVEEIETTISENNNDECLCMCGKGDNLTNEEKLAWTAELVGNLTIDVKKTGCYTRQKISMEDPRPSAQGCGFVAIAILSTVLGILLCMDSTTMCATFNARRCRNF